ncbi:peptide chain release factor N(5)-glutamine methyltransferase [Candidatus Saccharibacteria bacterium]|nr:peptide chain release factor N(5)-glutamine methyltransferase [Candidatus Saccharibacteria bacterium]
MKVQQLVEKTTGQFNSVGIPSARLDAELLLAHVVGKGREWVLAHGQDELTEAQTALFEQYVSRRLEREPVCYITNCLEFYGLNFYVDPRVLAPRVETELIAEQAIKHAPKDSTLIDIGTGSGAIAVTVAKHRPDLKITATEVSHDALQVARKNAAQILGAEHMLEFMHADVFDGMEREFDVVVTNLPYVSNDYHDRMKPEVQKEPGIALFGGPGDGLDLYRRFYEQLPKHIKPGSKVFHESDPWQHEELKKLAAQAGLKTILEDYLILGFEKS